MPDTVDMEALTEYAKKFSGLTPELEAVLLELGPALKPALPAVTESFYRTLQEIDKARPFLEGRVDSLKSTHQQWLESLFDGPYDASYTARMYHVGHVHVKVELPVEFMSGGMTLIGNELMPAIAQACGVDHDRCRRAHTAVNAVMGFSLMVMQESYQVSSLAEELEKFLAISGMSRALFDNLAKAYKK